MKREPVLLPVYVRKTGPFACLPELCVPGDIYYGIKLPTVVPFPITLIVSYQKPGLQQAVPLDQPHLVTVTDFSARTVAKKAGKQYIKHRIVQFKSDFGSKVLK